MKINHLIQGDIKGFPPVIVLAMMRERVLQKHECSIKMFLISRASGFSFAETRAGFVFWYKVVMGENFNLFFKNI